MPAILTIGYDYFLVKSEAQAIAALRALSEAIPMDKGYDRKDGEVYYPEDQTRTKGISITIIKANQLRKTKPRDDDDEKPVREVKLLDFNGKVHYGEPIK